MRRTRLAKPISERFLQIVRRMKAECDAVNEAGTKVRTDALINIVRVNAVRLCARKERSDYVW